MSMTQNVASTDKGILLELVDICRSLARYGPHKSYALNTGVSTMRPLELTAEMDRG